MIGQSIENYRIEELLGQGGMGAVYRATDMSLDRAVALKIMNPGVATNADFLRRFKSEARVLGRLQHPNIVNVYTFRHVDSHLIIVMEYVGGGTLGDLIDQHGAIPINIATGLLKQSLNALEFAHSSNIIHRDIKPPNILLTENHLVKVSDFGLAKIQEDSNATMVTRVGMTGGTLHYMPPEQTEALSNVDHRGDLYSLGMTFYQMLAGRVPFDRNSSAFSILRAIDQQKIPTPDSFNSSIPKELVDIVMKSINKYPDDRYQDASSMLAAIEHFEIGSGQVHGVQESFAKTEILSRPPSYSNSAQPGYSPQQLFQKSKSNSGHGEKYAVGSRSSSKVKKPKKPSRVSKAGKSIAEAPASSGKKLIPVLGIALLAIAGFFIVPKFFSSTTEVEPIESGINPGGQEAPQNATAGGDQTPDEPPDLAQNNGAGEDPVAQQGAGNATSTNEPPSPTSEVRSTPPPTVQTRTITILSTPSGATVMMNGRVRGRTPLTIDNIEPEVHAFQLSLDGYETVNRTLDVARQTQLNADLSPLSGQIRIVVRPFGDIFVDDVQKASGTSQVYTDELRVGTHTIKAQHPALGVWEKRVNISAGQEEEVLFNFAQKFIVTVASNPPNAEIVVDGEPLMTSRGPVTTPRQIQLPPGNHTITVRLQGFNVPGGPKDIVLEEDLADALFFTLETQ